VIDIRTRRSGGIRHRARQPPVDFFDERGKAIPTVAGAGEGRRQTRRSGIVICRSGNRTKALSQFCRSRRDQEGLQRRDGIRPGPRRPAHGFGGAGTGFLPLGQDLLKSPARDNRFTYRSGGRGDHGIRTVRCAANMTRAQVVASMRAVRRNGAPSRADPQDLRLRRGASQTGASICGRTRRRRLPRRRGCAAA